MSASPTSRDRKAVHAFLQAMPLIWRDNEEALLRFCVTVHHEGVVEGARRALEAAAEIVHYRWAGAPITVSRIGMDLRALSAESGEGET